MFVRLNHLSKKDSLVPIRGIIIFLCFISFMTEQMSVCFTQWWKKYSDRLLKEVAIPQCINTLLRVKVLHSKYYLSKRT